MQRLVFTTGEVREAPNREKYAFISLERTKGRVALLLIHTKNIQSSEGSIVSLALDTWSHWRLVVGENESARVTEEVRQKAYYLLHAPPDSRYKK